MRILISGTGHSGTCLLATVIKQLKIVRIKRGEDTLFFKHSKLPENYGTKLVTIPEYRFTLKNMTKTMRLYSDLYLIFSLRHPLDVFMSKIVRGQRPSEGGDGDPKRNRKSKDGTPDGAILIMDYFYNIYKNMIERFPERTFSVKTEDLILTPEKEVKRIAGFLKVETTQRALEFYKYNFNSYQKKRYGTELDKSTINIHKKWETWHDGFFKNRGSDIKKATLIMRNFIKDLGYEVL